MEPLAILHRNKKALRPPQKGQAGVSCDALAVAAEPHQLILRSAAELFAQHGYAGTSLRHIAQTVGLACGSLYHHFPSKEDLFVAIHREGFRQIIRRSKNAIRKEGDPWRRLELASAVHLDSALAGDAIDRITAVGLFAIHDTWLRRRLEEDHQRYEAHFYGLVDALDLPGIDNRSIFRLALLGAVNWAITWYKPGKMPPKEIARQLIQTFRTIADLGR